MCLRDDDGIFLAAKTYSFSHIFDFYKGEALGLMLAME